MKVSIIVPVYNGAEFLPGTVESVLNQTCGDWEMLLVDDGSTDGVTPALCDSIAARDSRICVFHKENGGQSDARNYALPHARGKYITFLDSDDLLHHEFLRIMLETAEKYDADIVFGNFNMFDKNCDFSNLSTRLPVITEEKTEVMRRIMYQTGYNNNVWGNIYRASLWRDTRFPVGVFYEDLHLSYRLVHAAHRTAWINFSFYGYRQHPKSFMHVWSERRLDALRVTDEMVEWVAKNAPELAAAAADRRMSAHFNILLELYKNKLNRPDIEQRCLNVIREQRLASLRDSHVRPKNRLGALVSILFGKKMLKFMAHFC